MAHKKLINFVEMMSKVKDGIALENDVTFGKFIPDIITFCYDKNYLDFNGKGVKLRPFQEIMLKVFYRGSKGNENLKLTDEEIELCRKNGLDTEDRGNVLEKYFSNEIFRELVLVWGRRGGKDFFCSIVATYEAMRLLECDGGNPYSIYELDKASPITILTVANAQDQAVRAFEQIREKIVGSKYFKDKMIQDGLETFKIYLLTPQDKIDNQDLSKRGLPIKKGSIIVEVGHSNSNSLTGKSIFVLILDEVAAYRNTGGSSSGDTIYTNLTPSLVGFNRTVIETNEYGEKVEKTIIDSKILSISSPLYQEGTFFNLYKDTPRVPDRLSCRLPTWAVVERLTEKVLREMSPQMTEEEFMMQYGAEFGGMGGETFLPKQKVENCFKPGFKMQDYGKPGVIYFAHLDPATSSHNYALIVVHREMFFNEETRKNDFNIVVDHIKYWHPTADTPINYNMVDEYILNLRKKFYFGIVTYDMWNSTESIKKLRKYGIPSKCTHYTKKYKMIIYDELYNLIASGRLKIPPHQLLRYEMLNIQRRFVVPHGYTVFPRKDGEVRTDDLVDSLSGACYNAISFSVVRLPQSHLVEVSLNPSSNARMWQSMSGPIGYGTGAQVASCLERIKSWPNSKR